MSYSDTKIIFIMTDKESYIPPLRQIGPIPNPLPVSVLVAAKCIQCGCPISEYDPETGLVVKLTLENLYDDQKFVKAKEEADAINRGEKKPTESDDKKEDGNEEGTGTKDPENDSEVTKPSKPDVGEGEVGFEDDDVETQSNSPSVERAKFLAEGFTNEEIDEMGIE